MEPGKTYLVPTINVMVGNHEVTVVVLHEHVGDLSGENHQHVDPRFMSDQVVEIFKKYFGEDFDSYILACSPIKTTMREMMCFRQHVPIKKFRRQGRIGFMILQKKWSHLKKTCNVCPHQGCNLSDVPVTKVGKKEVVVCPCHGLTWSVENGEMVRRLPRKQGVFGQNLAVFALQPVEMTSE